MLKNFTRHPLHTETQLYDIQHITLLCYFKIKFDSIPVSFNIVFVSNVNILDTAIQMQSLALPVCIRL